MENASEAIKMAGAIMIFTMALAVVMNMFTSARAAADGVMNKNDYTKTYYAADETAADDSITNNNFYLAYQKIVGIDEVISTMYNYKTEGTTILFYSTVAKEETDRTAEDVYTNESELKPIVLYFTEANKSVLAKSSVNVESYKYKNSENTINPETKGNRAIFGLSAADELTRNEPWTGSATKTNLFLNDLIAGRDYDNSTKWDTTSTRIGVSGVSHTYSTFNNQEINNNTGRLQLSYGFNLENIEGTNTKTIKGLTNKSNGFFGFGQNARFVERIGEYDYKSRTIIDDKFINEGTVVLSNDETIEAETTTTKKKVIQFIYLEDNP